MPSPDPLFIDLHSHLAPGVDDGAATPAEALEALRALRAEGVRSLVTTPHLVLPHLDTTAAIDRVLDWHRAGFDALLEAAAGADDVPELGLGQEIWAPDAATMRRALGRPGLGLAGTRFLLVEFGFDLTGSHDDVVEAVLEAGWRIVIAHPERYEYAPGFDPLETAAGWRALGALLQINAGSLTGHYLDSRPASRSLAWRLVEQGLADLIATDHHGSSRAGVSPREAYDALVAAGRAREARRLMAENPARVLRGWVPCVTARRAG